MQVTDVCYLNTRLGMLDHVSDVYILVVQVDLIVEPDATFFKASWSKHTNFCQQDIEISQNSGQMAYGQEIQYQVS